VRLTCQSHIPGGAIKKFVCFIVISSSDYITAMRVYMQPRPYTSSFRFIAAASDEASYSTRACPCRFTESPNSE
jgi:hypothetical protein